MGKGRGEGTERVEKDKRNEGDGWVDGWTEKVGSSMKIFEIYGGTFRFNEFKCSNTEMLHYVTVFEFKPLT